MPIPSICLDARLRQFAEAFRSCWSQPQMRHFVTVLLGRLQCQESHTLTGLRRQVANGPSVASLRRFLARAPWSTEAMVQTWWGRFGERVEPEVQAERQRQRAARPPPRGRPPQPVVVGSLIGDESTVAKPKGRKMEGLGRHHSTTAGKRVKGHRLVQSRDVVLGRRCPLAPRLDRQRAVCAAAGVPFASKVDLMAEVIATFEPLPDTLTHVLLDSWYSAKRLWKAARTRGFLITTGLKQNRARRIADPDAARGWRWQRLDASAQALPAAAYQVVAWPAQNGPSRLVDAHAVSTRVRTRSRCQVLVVRETPEAEPRCWASSDLEADLPTRLRFWTLVLAAYAFLDEERARLHQQTTGHVTLGEARRAVQRRHQDALVAWICDQQDGGQSAATLAAFLAA